MNPSKNLNSSSSSNEKDPNYRVDVVWDFECGWISNVNYLKDLKKRIEISLKKAHKRYYVGTITAVGPPFGNFRRELRQYFPEIEELCTSDENIYCGEQGCKVQTVHSHDPTKPELIMRTSDRADVIALILIYAHVLCNGKNVLVITDDADFFDPIEALRGFPTNTNVMVARSGPNPTNTLAGTKTWNFEEMIQNGGSDTIRI